MSFYADYVRERFNKQVWEDQTGFIVWHYVETKGMGRCLYIEDIYVEPQHRLHGAAARMADQVVEEAAANGVFTVLGTVDVTAFNASDSMKTLLAYGMVPLSTEGNLVWFRKG